MYADPINRVENGKLIHGIADKGVFLGDEEPTRRLPLRITADIAVRVDDMKAAEAGAPVTATAAILDPATGARLHAIGTAAGPAGTELDLPGTMSIVKSLATKVTSPTPLAATAGTLPEACSENPPAAGTFLGCAISSGQAIATCDFPCLMATSSCA
jgi:hypothetical protein